MKQLIVLMAILPILLIFMVQAAIDQKNSSQIAQIKAFTYAAKEEAKQAGFFDNDIKDRLKSNISKALRIPESEIVIESDNTVKYRYSQGENRLIYYKVKVPVRGIMAGAEMMEIEERENSILYTIDSYTASERVE